MSRTHKTLAVGLVLPALSAQARDADDPPIAIGPAFGLTFASETAISLGYGYSYASRIGQRALIRPAIGMSVKVPLKGPWQFVPELYYTQFGSRLGPFAISYHHLAFPLLARADFAKAKPVTPFFLVGGQVSFRLGTDAASNFSFYSYFGYSTSYGLGANPLDAGPVVGFGVEFPIKNIEVHFDARFYHSAIPHPGAFGQLELHRQVGVFGGLYF